VKSPRQRLGRTPLDHVRVPAGALRIRVSMAGYQAVEIAVNRVAAREPPASSYNMRLYPAGSALSRMVTIPATPATSDVRLRNRSLEEFDIDMYEVTNREFQEFVNRGGYRNHVYWKTPFVQDGRVLSWEQAIAHFVDPTGRPGPATWEEGTYPPGQDSYPVSGVSWYEAAAYAEFAGKSLPTVAHWVRASNLYDVWSDLRFLLPLSNIEGTDPQAVGVSGAVNSLGLYDIAGNVREWCWNDSGGRRSILGGSWADKDYGVGEDNAAPFDRSATNGFRCVRYRDPENALQQFGGPIWRERWPDYNRVTPVSDGKATCDAHDASPSPFHC
jgi:eukaryotic-like serine/threonine-protein kinase